MVREGERREEGSGGEGKFLAFFFWCVLFFLDPPKKPGPYFLNYTPKALFRQLINNLGKKKLPSLNIMN